MGPYCKFCDNRCFTYMPEGTPPRAIKAYGPYTIIATCPEGQKFEMEKVGWCYDRIMQEIEKSKSLSV